MWLNKSSDLQMCSSVRRFYPAFPVKPIICICLPLWCHLYMNVLWYHHYLECCFKRCLMIVWRMNYNIFSSCLDCCCFQRDIFLRVNTSNVSVIQKTIRVWIECHVNIWKRSSNVFEMDLFWSSFCQSTVLSIGYWKSSMMQHLTCLDLRADTQNTLRK